MRYLKWYDITTDTVKYVAEDAIWLVLGTAIADLPPGAEAENWVMIEHGRAWKGEAG